MVETRVPDEFLNVTVGAVPMPEVASVTVTGIVTTLFSIAYPVFAKVTVIVPTLTVGGVPS